ncbi:MAG: XRE family transcriptional regulator [Chitinophagaceae bacterium]|nr:MAG: XRE family transcriptional regulator [Chitinophagaceae bacterium]
MTIGQRIRHARKQRQLSQEQLANKCRCTRFAIMGFERDGRDVHAFLFIEIGRALGVSLDWLAFGKPQEQARPRDGVDIDAAHRRIGVSQ